MTGILHYIDRSITLLLADSKPIIHEFVFRFTLKSAAIFLAMVCFSGVLIIDSTAAQDTVGAMGDSCDDVRYLMQHEVTPDALLQGGGMLYPGQMVPGTISPNDIGDHWSFVVSGATNSTTMTVTFAYIPAGINLEMGLFRGMNRQIDSVTYLPVVSGQTYSLKTPRDGIYTLVVQLAQISALDTITQPQQYQMTAVFNGNSDVAAELDKRPLRDAQTSQDFRDYEVADGKQVLTFSGGAQFLVNPGSLTGVSNRSDAAGQLSFERGSLIITRWAETVSVLGGNLSVTGTVNGQPRLYYLENFGYEGTLISPVQSSLQDITDSNSTRIATDWENITGLWVMTDCMGYRLADGISFTVPISDQQVKRSFIVRGAPDPVQVNCSAFYVRMDALDATSNTVSQSLCFTLQPIKDGSEITMNRGVFHAELQQDRAITLQSNTIHLLPLAVGYPEVLPKLALDIALKGQNQDITIRLDWVNLLDFSYIEQSSEGWQLHFGFSDNPRTTTDRPGNDLLFLDALQDVIHIVYRGDGQNGANGRELLLLPREDSYLEIDTPAGNPTFGGAPFDGTALPNQPGYQPRALNNLGGECYPVNTALDLNCSPNGDINPANSNLWYAITDLIAYSPVFDLALTRSYNSYDYAVDGPFGLGWSSPFAVDYAIPFDELANSRPVASSLIDRNYPVGLDLTWVPRGIITFRTSSGSRHTFVLDTTVKEFSGEIFRALTMPGWSLSRTGIDRSQKVASPWKLVTDSGLTYEFDRGGRLVSFGYPAQNYRVAIEYLVGDNFAGPANQMVVISDDSSRRRLELHYDDNAHIDWARLWDMTAKRNDSSLCILEESCFEVHYGYDGDYLISVTYPDGQTAAYTYENGRLKTHDDPRAPVAPAMSYEYGQGGAVTSASISDTDVAGIVWRQLDALVDGNMRQVSVTDELGNQTMHSYWLETGTLTTTGKSYIQVESTSPLRPAGGFEARPIEYEWQNGLLTTIKQRYVVGTGNDGRNTINLRYTPTGRLMLLDGGYPGMKMDLYTASDPLPIADILPTSIDFGSGTSQLLYTYDDAGYITDFTDANGAAYHIERDPWSRPTLVTRAQDHVAWRYIYDDTSSMGLLQSIQQYFTEDANDPGYTILFTWDGLGRLVRVEDEILGTYRIEYRVTPDAEGIFLNEIILTDPGNATTISHFDRRNRLVETILLPPTSDGSDYVQRTTYEYDPNDALGRVSAVVQWLRDDTTETPLRTTYRYENIEQIEINGTPVYIGGMKLTMLDPYGRPQYIIYDALGRVRETGDWMQLRSQFEYQVDKVRNPLPIDELNLNGLRIVQHEYLAGQEIATTEYIFDFGWQLTGISRTETNPFVTIPDSWTGEWRFLSNSPSSINQNVRRLQTPLVGLDEIIWDAVPYVNGRPQQVQVQRDSMPAYLTRDANLGIIYDFLGRPSQITQEGAAGPQVVYLSYCALPAGQYQVLHSRPGANAAVSCQNPDAAAIGATYDAHDRLRVIWDEYGMRHFDYTADAATGGYRVTMEAGAYTEYFAYDAADRLVRWADAGATTHEYSYDTLGRLIRVSVADQSEASFTFKYNEVGLIIWKADDTGRGFAYEYNSRGQLILQQNLLTRDTTSYTYNALGQLDSVISPLGHVITYEYDDPVDPTRVTAIITASGRSEYSWNNEQNTITYTDGRGQHTTYTFDALGALWQIASPEGLVEQFNYDSSGYLTSWQTSEEGTVRNLNINYDAAMNQATLSTDSVENWRWTIGFTSAEQITRLVNPAGQALDFRYDSLGRLAVLRADDNIQWDISHQPGTSTIHLKDGFGQDFSLSYDALYRLILIQQQNDDVNTDYTYQPTSSGNGVVNLRVDNGYDVQVYTFLPGDDRHSPAVVIHSTGERTTYLYDAEGQLVSIKRLVCTNSPMENIADKDLSTFDLETPEVCDSDTTAGSRLWSVGVGFRYDGLGQPIGLIDEDQQVESFSYDSVGNLIRYQNADGKTYTYEYDGLNRLSRLTSPGGIDLFLHYNLDKVAGVCQGLTEDHLDYAGCAAQGGELETYMYDSLGRLVSRHFPNITPDQLSDVNWTYAAAGAGSPTGIGNADLSYTANGLALLNRIVNQNIVYRNMDQIGSTNDLSLEYDPQGRLTRLQTGSSDLNYSYDDNGLGYTITDGETGAALSFELQESGLLNAVNYQPGSTNENELILQILQAGQIENGGGDFQFQWRDGYTMDVKLNRQGNEVSLSHLPSQLGSDLYIDYVFTPTGSVQRQVISGISPDYFDVEVTEGYISVLGYDRNDRLLTLRVSDLGSTRLLYQETFVYTDFGQLESEVRQYENGIQVRIEYQYNVRNQLASRAVTINSTDTPFAAASMLFVLTAGLIYGVWRRARPLMVAGLALIALGVANPTGPVDAQEQGLNQAIFTYEYDGYGNLRRVQAGAATCAEYTYDTLNRLSGVQMSGNSTRYQYDVFNRLIGADNTQFVYAGTSMPFIVHDGQTTYQIQSASGQQLFSATGDQVNPFIYGGQGQILGVRNLNEVDASTQSIWLFDPLGRFVNFDSPEFASNGCQLLAPAWPDTLQRYQMIGSSELWDVTTNLVFTVDGRVYLPELGRFLQRDPLGPDAQGNIYDAVSTLSHPPIRYRSLPARTGLQKLEDALLEQTQADRLSATFIVSDFVPTPSGQWQSPFAQSLQRTATQLRNEMITLLNIPDWLGRNYNLPAPRIDTVTGALQILPDNAPGQGGFGDAVVSSLDAAIWQRAVWTPTQPSDSMALITSLAQHTATPFPSYRTYLDQGWLPRGLRLQDTWTARVPDLSRDLTPAAVLEYLPRPLNITQNISDWLIMVESFQNIETMRSVDWVYDALESTLPTVPTLPPLDTEAWRQEWFSTDTLGTAQLLNNWRNLPVPEIPAPVLEVNDLR